MLKIKDSVDLKELEKFGYAEINNKFSICNQYEKSIIDNEIIDIIISIDEIFMFNQYKKMINEYEFSEKQIKYIQDLIDAGLVEKVFK